MERLEEIINITDEDKKIELLSGILARAFTDYNNLERMQRAVAFRVCERALSKMVKLLPRQEKGPERHAEDARRAI